MEHYRLPAHFSPNCEFICTYETCVYVHASLLRCCINHSTHACSFRELTELMHRLRMRVRPCLLFRGVPAASTILERFGSSATRYLSGKPRPGSVLFETICTEISCVAYRLHTALVDSYLLRARTRQNYSIPTLLDHRRQLLLSGVVDRTWEQRRATALVCVHLLVCCAHTLYTFRAYTLR